MPNRKRNRMHVHNVKDVKQLIELGKRFPKNILTKQALPPDNKSTQIWEGQYAKYLFRRTKDWELHVYVNPKPTKETIDKQIEHAQKQIRNAEEQLENKKNRLRNLEYTKKILFWESDLEG